jgi:hypothetical protein
VTYGTRREHARVRARGAGRRAHEQPNYLWAIHIWVRFAGVHSDPRHIDAVVPLHEVPGAVPRSVAVGCRAAAQGAIAARPAGCTAGARWRSRSHQATGQRDHASSAGRPARAGGGAGGACVSFTGTALIRCRLAGSDTSVIRHCPPSAASRGMPRRAGKGVSSPLEDIRNAPCSLG